MTTKRTPANEAAAELTRTIERVRFMVFIENVYKAIRVEGKAVTPYDDWVKKYSDVLNALYAEHISEEYLKNNILEPVN